MAKSKHHSRPFSNSRSYLSPMALITCIILAMLSLHAFS